MLLIDGCPIISRWPDGGSIGHELFLTKAGQGSLLADDQLRRLVQGNVDSHLSLRNQFLPLLALFSPGDYTLRLESLTDSWEMCDWDVYPTESGDLYMYQYPSPPVTLVLMQPVDRLDETRILKWMYALEQGARPLIITASVEQANYEFVLDGHHKLTAYALARLAPWRLRITRHNAPAFPIHSLTGEKEEGGSSGRR